VADHTRAFVPWDPEHARAIIESLKHLPGATLPVLHALHDEFGYIHGDAIPLVAEALNLSRAEIVGVVNFYHDFRQEPPAAHLLQVCRAEACQSMGCESLVAHIEQQLGVAMGGATAGQGVALQAVYCLGNCALSPAVMLDGRLHGRVTPTRVDSLLAAVRS
jgi:formate dehydrogenase subunit gamma